MVSRFRVNRPKVVDQTIDGEAVIINLETGKYYSLLRSGALIWGLIADSASTADIVAALAGKYQGTHEVFEHAVAGLVRELSDEGLISPVLDGDPPLSVSPAWASVSIGETQRLPFEPPLFEKFEDMKYLMLLDPVHEVNEGEGWPRAKSEN